MESFTITIDLKSFFGDFRAKSVVFVDTTALKKVKHVVHHIKTLFGIESDAYVFSHDYFVPGAEDSRVLKTLPSIRLDSVTSSCQSEGESNTNDKLPDTVSITTATNFNQAEIYVDKNELSNTGHSSKKKKHKRKRINSESGDHEGSANQQANNNVSDDLSSIANKAVAPEDCQREISNGDLNTIKHTPIGAFYTAHQLVVQNGELINESLPKRHRRTCSSQDTFEWDNVSNLNMSSVDDTSTEIVASDSNANTDAVDSKPKRKRIRRRKKPYKPKDVSHVAETEVPQITTQPAFKTPKLLTAKSNHIYFSEDGLEELETQARTQDVKNTPEDVSVNVLLKCPDIEKGEVQEQETHNQSCVSDDAIKIQEINNQHNISEDPLEEPNTKNQSLSLDSGTGVVQTASPSTVKVRMQQNRHSMNVERGLGKLLSLVKSDSPPVFERRKVMKTEQPPAENGAESSSTSQGANILTPLKAIPAANTKISFKILKMSALYCPELSNSITAIVKEANQETQELLLKILSGAEECKNPKGKFDLDSEAAEEEIEVDEIKRNWNELIEPCSCP